MLDWKDGLRQAAGQLELDSKAKIKKLVLPPIVDMPALTNAIERPHKPGMPGKPNTLPAKYPSLLVSVTANTIASANSRQIDSRTGLTERVNKKSFPPPEKKLMTNSKNRIKPLPPPLIGRLQWARPTREILERIANPARVITPSLGRTEASQFKAPNMAEYTICHAEADASGDQSWQDIGAASTLRQFQNRGQTQCTVGLDFGTAFTKACVQIRDSTFVVHWDGAVPQCTPFLLPGVLTVLPDGVCVLGTVSGGLIRTDLKMALLSGASEESKIYATAFLTLATRYVRSWLFSKHGNIVSGFQLEWSVNVGLPAVRWDDTDLCRLYQGITLAGWRLGATAGPITISGAKATLSGLQADTSTTPLQILRDRIATFPEFVAQINSYRKSAQRRLDLHLLIDVGAGTVDMATFHVSEPEENDCYSILEASVENRGTHVLLSHRAAASGLGLSTWDEAAARLQMRQFESKYKLTEGTLRPVDCFFAHQLFLSIQRLLRATRSRRYETSPAWREAVPFFFSGGGRNVDVYREAIARIVPEERLLEMPLPLPEGLKSGKLPRQDFHRVSVAHGLSYSADNLGKIERRSEVPDLQRPRSSRADYTSRYVDKSDT